MLGKLIKHEFRATSRTMLPLLGAVIIMTVLANFSLFFINRVQSSALQILLTLIIIAFFLMLFATAVMSVVVMISRFYKNLLSDEGYLMMTLPTGVHSLIWSKLIVSFVWFVVSGIVAVAALLVTVFCCSGAGVSDIFSGFPSWSELTYALHRLGLTGFDIAGYIAEFLLAVIAGSAMLCLQFYAAMALGHSFANNKVLLSVVFFVGLSFVFQVLDLVFVLPFGIDLSYTVPQAPVEIIGFMHKMMLSLLAYETIHSAILYVLTTLGLKKHLNLS